MARIVDEVARVSSAHLRINRDLIGFAIWMFLSLLDSARFESSADYPARVQSPLRDS